MIDNTSTPNGDRVDNYKKYLSAGEIVGPKVSVFEPASEFDKYIKNGDAILPYLNGEIYLDSIRDFGAVEMIVGTLPKKDLNNLKEVNKKKEIASIEAHDKGVEDKRKEDVDSREK